MDKESLEKARNLIIETLEHSDLNVIDKYELIRNLSTLLDEANYEEDIKVLTLQNKKRRH